MALMDWKSLPDTSTPITPENLEHDPAELDTKIGEKVSKSGDTMTGNLTIGSSDASADKYIDIISTGHSGRILTKKNGNFGLYDNTNSKWLVYSNTSGVVALNGNAATATTASACSGNAATATKATQDGSGNNIVNTYQQKPVNLYNSTNGTTGNVTLSETSANFSYLDIWFKGANGSIDFVRVFNPNGQTVNLHSANSDGTHAWFQFNVCSISGKAITRQGKYELSMYGSGIDGIYTTNIYIVRVDGIK